MAVETVFERSCNVHLLLIIICSQIVCGQSSCADNPNVNCALLVQFDMCTTQLAIDNCETVQLSFNYYKQTAN